MLFANYMIIKKQGAKPCFFFTSPAGRISAYATMAEPNRETDCGTRKDQRKQHRFRCCFLWYSLRESNPQLALRSPSQMPILYAKCVILFIFVRFMQYFPSILHNILRFERCFLCLLIGSKT